MSDRTQIISRAGRRTLTYRAFRALPDAPEVHRELIDGQLYEEPMTYHDALHGSLVARIAARLILWAETQPEPQPEVVAGDAGLRVRPHTLLAADVAVLRPGQASAIRRRKVAVGVPLLAVEVMSPSDSAERTSVKVSAYLSAEVPLLWLVNPLLQQVQAFQGERVTVVTRDGELAGGDVLPGLALPLAALFPAPARRQKR